MILTPALDRHCIRSAPCSSAFCPYRARLVHVCLVSAFLQLVELPDCRPTVAEVRDSLEGWGAGRSIPGFQKNVGKDFLQPLYHRCSKLTGCTVD